MNAELAALEEKVNRLIEFTLRLRSENQQLRQQLTALEHDNMQLSNKIKQAAERIDRLLVKIPAE